MRGLSHALRGWRRQAGREFHAQAEDFCQEALLKILDNLDTFRGLSQFTTWAHKIAIRIALTELRRKRWQDVSLDLLVEQDSGSADAPDAAAERSDFVARMHRIMETELTEKQRTAITAVAYHGMPLEEVARRMDTNRNALYKLIHDGRVRIERRLERDGMTPADILSSMAGP